jgi:transposase
LARSRLASRRYPARSDSKEVWDQKPEVGMSFARVDGESPTETEVRALMKVLIGVDPHKVSLAVAAVDEATGELLEHASFPQDRAGLRSLQRWARRFSERRWAVENAGGLGRYLATRLAGSGESVVDVPPKLSARVRVLSTGNSRKNDGLDALATASEAASRNERLAAVDPEATSEVLRLLSERREDLVAERTRALNRLHALLRDLLPGGVSGKLSTERAARILRSIRPRSSSSRIRRRLASEVLRDIRTLDGKIADLGGRIEAEVEACGTTLPEIFGVGPILAAKIIGTVGRVGRFPTKAH